MADDSFNLFFSFRARIVFFVLLILLLTILALSVLNRHSEARITQLVAAHIEDTSRAVDLAQSSFPSGRYLYKLIPEDGRLRVGLDESHIIHRILIADAEGKIIDSSEQGDLDQPIQQILGHLTPAPYAKPPLSTAANAQEPEQILTYPVITEKGERHVVIVISPHRLGEIVREERWERWLGITSLSLLLLCTVALASWRFTRPINELMQAARRVSAGDFDFNLNIARRDEMGLLTRTFNEMLNGLRGKRELEERLQRAERSALTGRIAAGIAHEIRNPLSFINLTVDYIRDKYAPAAEAARRDYTQLIDSVKEEIVRLNGMVSDFLNFGRPARLKLRELDARELVAEVVTLVRAKAELQQVTINVREASDEAHADFHFQRRCRTTQDLFLKHCHQRRASDDGRRLAHDYAASATAQPPRGIHRHRPRHCARSIGANLRAVFFHEGNRHRPGAGTHAQTHRRPRWTDSGQQRSRRRHQLHHHLAACACRSAGSGLAATGHAAKLLSLCDAMTIDSSQNITIGSVYLLTELQKDFPNGDAT